MSDAETTSTPESATPHELRTVFQRDPFQRRMSACSGKPAPPTAHTAVRETASTAFSSLGWSAPPGFGEETIRHRVPFHRSTSVVLFRDAKSSARPTAQTALGATETASSSVKKSAPGHVGLGVGTMVH